MRNLIFYDGASSVIDFMWSSSIAEMLRTLFNLEEPSGAGPPPEHESASEAHGIDWNLDRAPLKPVFGFSFHSDVSFEVLKTLHTYVN